MRWFPSAHAPRGPPLPVDVWLRYLGDLRSPWRTRRRTRTSRDAFRRARQRRNHELEDKVVDALAAMGLHVVRRVKKPQVIGLDPGALPGEIDAVAIDAERRSIWVVEVKDPQEMFSGMQIEQSIRDFLRPQTRMGRQAVPPRRRHRSPRGRRRHRPTR